MKTVDQFLKYATFSVCAYEAFSGFTRLTPTVSQFVGVYQWLGVPILVGLGLHLYWPQVKSLYRKVAK